MFFIAPLPFAAMAVAQLKRDIPLVPSARRRFSRRVRAMPAWGWLLIAVGLLALVMIYLPLMSPRNAMFDARWKHLALAEEWVAPEFEEFSAIEVAVGAGEVHRLRPRRVGREGSARIWSCGGGRQWLEVALISLKLRKCL